MAIIHYTNDPLQERHPIHSYIAMQDQSTNTLGFTKSPARYLSMGSQSTSSRDLEMKLLDVPTDHPVRDAPHKRKRSPLVPSGSNVDDTDQTVGLLDGLSLPKAEAKEDIKQDAQTIIHPRRLGLTIDRLNTKESAFGKRQVTPLATHLKRERSILQLAASPAYRLQREWSVIDLTASSPYMKKESCTPSIHLFGYRSQSVIEISSDSDPDNDGNSSDSLSSDDPGKYFTTMPSRPRPADTVIKSRLPPIEEEQNPKPPRTGNISRACHLSSPTPNPKVEHPNHQPSLSEGGIGDSNRVHEPKVFVRSGGAPQRLDGLAHSLQVGLSSFRELTAAKNALVQYEEKRGYQWIVQKTKLDKNKQPTKLVMQCRCAKEHKQVHDPTIDPSQLREGKSVKTGCEAIANLKLEEDGVPNRTIRGQACDRFIK